MAGWLWKSLRRLSRSFVQWSGGEFQDEMRRNKLGDDASKTHWSELSVDVPSKDVVTSIVKSKEHWSELPVDVPGSTDSEILAESETQARNETSWKALQNTNPFFFQDWSQKVQVGQQIAEGGQAKIYEAKWKDKCSGLPEYIDLPDRLVVKVFKLEGCTLEDFMCQWPRINATSQKLLELERATQFASYVRYTYVCPIIGAYFLKDKTFAFLMQRYTCDLRSHLQNEMRDNKGRGLPFPDRQDVMYVLLCIAKGMRWLHGHGVLHRDLKASNVLMRPLGRKFLTYAVADYECSMSTIGTGFWRAPEVLQEMRHPSGRNVDVWTTKSDVYSFGMICFEVLTGEIPFSEYSKKDWTEIIDRHKRPQLPDSVDLNLQQLVKRCWDKDPLERPSFHDIVKELKKLRG